MTQNFNLFADRVLLNTEELDGYQIGPASLSIQGNHITAAKPMTREAWENTAPSLDITAIDLGDQLVTPAFINGHTHLSMVMFRGLDNSGMAMARNVVEDLYFKVESQLSSEDIYAFSRVGAYENLLHGVGTVWDHYYSGVAVADAIYDAGLTGVVAPTLQDVGGPGVASLEPQWRATLAIHENTKYEKHGITAAWGPHATDTVSDALWKRIAAASQEYDIPIHAHVAQSVEEYTFNMEQHQRSPVERLQHLGVLAQAQHMLLVHGIYINLEDLKRLDPKQHTLGFCPYSQLQYAFPANILAWAEAEMPWLLATDCAASNDSMNVQKEMRFVHGMRVAGATWASAYETFRQSGTPAHAKNIQKVRTQSFHKTEAIADTRFLLSRVWSVPGRMHNKLQVGSLAPGHRANLVVWDPDHPSMWPCIDPLRTLALADSTPAITGMMINGAWIGERDNFAHSLRHNDGYRKALQEPNQRLQVLIKN